MDKGTKNYSLDHIFAGTNLGFLVDKTKSTRDGLKIAHTKIDPSKLVQNVDIDFIDLDSPKDDEPIIVQDESDEKVHGEKIQCEEPKETKDASATHPPSPNSLPTKLKELPSKFNELIREVKELKKHVHDLEIKLPRDLKDIPNKLETFTSTVKIESVQAKIKTLDALSSLLKKVTEALNKFAQVIDYASKKTRDTGVPLAGQAGSHPAEGEKNTQHVTISQLFQRKFVKDAKNTNLNKPIPTTSIISPIITDTTTQLQSLFLLSPPKSSSQPEGGLIKKDKGKGAMSSKDVE
uniref:Uncharacterized protein n=1 Tax=Tanacetum cinerariifolium TaxID=118510 RepID=A0A6L2K272_TANCI|nr:hypothetical protein [Tanacetum cinerariifolium]